jgi:hypothetical protein
MTIRRRRVTPVRVGPPKSVPITAEEYQQAVSAIAPMIARWWETTAGTCPVPARCLPSPRQAPMVTARVPRSGSSVISGSDANRRRVSWVDLSPSKALE